jgi:hypothetical protein
VPAASCGEINDMKTLIAGYWFAERRAQLR